MKRELARYNVLIHIIRKEHFASVYLCQISGTHSLPRQQCDVKSRIAFAFTGNKNWALVMLLSHWGEYLANMNV